MKKIYNRVKMNSTQFKSLSRKTKENVKRST